MFLEQSDRFAGDGNSARRSAMANRDDGEDDEEEEDNKDNKDSSTIRFKIGALNP